jgi:hypothetical protein
MTKKEWVMFRKSVAVFVSVLLACVVLCARGASAQTLSRAEEEVKAGVERLGVGEGARVEVRLRDGGKLRGHVSEAGADYFVVKDARTGAATAVAYPDVAQVKGNNLSTGAKVAIGAGIAAAAVIAFIRWAGQFK